METTWSNRLSNFFGVALKPQTYLNSLYLLLAFPLGLFYFIFLVVGLSLGLGLAIVWIGLAILLVVFAAWYGLAAFERQMAIWLLREEIPPMMRPDVAARSTQMSLWDKFKSTLSNPVTWKGLLYLAAKFPLGLLSFVVLVTLLSLSAALIAAPFYYQIAPPQVDLNFGNNVAFNNVWIIDTPFEAGIAVLVGLLVLMLSLHVFNGLAWFSGKFARVMLGNFQPVPAASPVTSSPAAATSSAETPAGPQIYETAEAIYPGPSSTPDEPASTGE